MPPVTPCLPSLSCLTSEQSLRPVLLFLRFCAPLPGCGCRACAPPSPPPPTASAGRAAAAVHAVGPPHQHSHPGEPPGHAPDQTQGPGCPDLHPLAGAAGPLPAPGGAHTSPQAWEGREVVRRLTGALSVSAPSAAAGSWLEDGGGGQCGETRPRWAIAILTESQRPRVGVR